ncbi:MAG: 50S ribosomal protein L4 [Parachlamydiales bacterium]
MKAKKYTVEGASAGEMEVGKWLEKCDAHAQMVKDYVIAIRENMRQWSACTQTRGEVNHSGKKPHRQKGTGNARQGSLAAPHYRGGGVVFGPRPKFDQHVRINQKERRKAIQALLGEKLREGHFFVVEDFQLETPKTKAIVGLLKGIGVKGRTLIVGAENVVEAKTEGKTLRVSSPNHEATALRKSVQNLPKVEFTLLPNLNGYDLLKAANVVLTESAVKQLKKWEKR